MYIYRYIDIDRSLYIPKCEKHAKRTCKRHQKHNFLLEWALKTFKCDL